jgi:hypothetical protein
VEAAVEGNYRGAKAAVEAAVELLRLVEVSRPPLRCLRLLSRCEAAVEMFKAAVEV